jgi:WD40 repeat protein
MFFRLALLLIGGVLLVGGSARAAEEKVNYQDHVLPLFRNSCLNCHNPDKKKAGLDLSNYQAALTGSDNGPVINAGDPDGSRLFRVVTHAEEPTMPPKKDKLPEKELNVIKSWILGGALETKTGKPIASNKPKMNLSVAVASAQKPAGPVPMPRDLVLEPFVHADRAWAPNCIASSPWAPVVAVCGQHQVLLYNPQTLELLGVVPFPEGEPCVARFSRSGKMLMIGGGVAAKSGKVVLWDITAGQRVTDVGEEFDEVLAADLSPDQTTVALGGPTKVLKIYSTQDGSALQSVKKHTDWITSISYSPDGVLLASGDRAGGLWVWEAKTGREFYNLAGHKAGVTAVAFRDDSNYLASASEDGTIKLWDMQSGNQLKTWNAHGGGVTSLSFTHDGRLVSCGRDRVVKLWKPDGSQIRQLDAFNDIALQTTFNDDGKRVIAADWTGDIRVWDAESGKLAGRLNPNPPPLAERLAAAEKKVADLKVLNDKATAELTPAQQTAQKASAALQLVLNEAADKAQADLEKTAAQFKSARQMFSAGSTDIDKATINFKQAVEALAKAQASYVALQNSLAAKANDVKAADAQLAKAKAATEVTTHDLADASNELARLKIGQFFLGVYAARNELVARQAEQDQLVAAAAAAQAEADKANGSIAALQKRVTEGPGRLKAGEEAIAKAEQDAAAAQSAIGAAQGVVEQKQAIIHSADELVQKIAGESAKSLDNKVLADAAAKAKAILEPLTADLENAKKAVELKSEAAKSAVAAVTAAQVSLAKEKAEIEAAPQKVAALQELAAKATAEVPKRKSAVDEAAKATAAAKAKADQLNAEYLRQMQQAGLDQPTVAAK